MKMVCTVISPWSMDIYDVKQRGMKDTSEYRLLRGMIAAGFEVHLIIPDKNGGGDSVDYDGIILHTYSFFSIPSVRNRLLNNFFKKCNFVLLIISSTIKTLVVSRKTHANLYYGFSSLGSVVAYLIGRVRGVPNVSRIFGTFLYPFINSKFQLLLRFDEVLGFIVPCQYLIITNDGTKGDIVAEKFGIPEEKIKYWINGSDDIYDPFYDSKELRKSLDIDPSNTIVLWVSRLGAWKRVDRLIASIPYIVKQKSAVTFLIVGDGDQRKNLEKQSEILGVMKYVRFLGALSHHNVQRLMNSADIFVSLYDLSNVGSPLLEAMRCARCIVALNNGDTNTIILNNENGILMDHYDPATLAEIIVALIDNESFRYHLGQNARSYAKDHFQTWDERIRMEINLLKKIP